MNFPIFGKAQKGLHVNILIGAKHLIPFCIHYLFHSSFFYVFPFINFSFPALSFLHHELPLILSYFWYFLSFFYSFSLFLLIMFFLSFLSIPFIVNTKQKNNRNVFLSNLFPSLRRLFPEKYENKIQFTQKIF